MEKIDERIPGIDLPLMSVSQTRGVIRRSQLTDAPQRAESLDAYKVCRRNDVVFNKMSIRAGAMGVAAEDGLVTYHYEVMRPREGTNPNFIAYLMKSSWFTEELIKRERGIGAGDQANVRTTEVPFSVLKTIDAYIPGYTTQCAIASYLDRETARIDMLTEEQQRLIDMLRERRRSVISSALAPTDSWVRRRIKHIGETSLGKMLDAGRAVRDGDHLRPYVRAADVRADGSVNLVDLNEMPFSEAEMEVFDLRAGDVLLIEGGATVGRPGFMFDSAPGIAFQKTVNRLRVGPQADARFVYWSMLRLYESAYYANHYGAVSFVHLTGEKLREIELYLPRLDEQRAIAVYLDEQTAKIDALIAETVRFIELARERRAALITAAVTGQIDLREMA
ncbi:restriction endonuclease subunit S [Micromonospora sp. DT229]|uniref:restriction endonuclease subunit S n=1 Tax=Micromonospora sp. DT229 TaxID=3393430 RepID=UPI003CEF7CDA